MHRAAARAHHPGPVGLPIVTPGPVPDDLMPLAKRAVALCPTLALLLRQEE